MTDVVEVFYVVDGVEYSVLDDVIVIELPEARDSLL